MLSTRYVTNEWVIYKYSLITICSSVVYLQEGFNIMLWSTILKKSKYFLNGKRIAWHEKYQVYNAMHCNLYFINDWLQSVNTLTYWNRPRNSTVYEFFKPKVWFLSLFQNHYYMIIWKLCQLNHTISLNFEYNLEHFYLLTNWSSPQYTEGNAL